MASEPLKQIAPPTAAAWVRKNRVRLLKFAGVGVSGVFVNLAIFAVIYHIVLTPAVGENIQFIAANAAGFVISVFTNFLFNDWWTWGDRHKGEVRHWFQRLGKYYVTASSAGAVQLVTAWLSLFFWIPLDPTIVDFKLAPILGVLTGIGCGMAINFTASHLWAFRDVPPPRK